MPSNSTLRHFRAPGRVNIIGEHIDYVGGTVLPFACDLELEVTSIPTDGPIEFSPEGAQPYAEGVAAALLEAGRDVLRRRGEVSSTIPVGAGLSSSAALEAALALALTDGVPPEPAVLQRAEYLATGVPCGVMDQTAVLKGRAGNALLLDCATGTIEYVPIDPAIEFVVIDTGTRRALADGRYAQRRAEVEAGDRKRMRHVEGEQRRVYDAVDALRAGDPASLGALVSASHASLRDDFEVSSQALDSAIETASSVPGCRGARLVGAGFAGCVLAVAESGAGQALVDRFDTAWIVSAVNGAGPA